MTFLDLKFFSNGFSLTREDKLSMFFPYSKFDYLTVDEKGRMRLEIKKHGAFTRDYDDIELMKEDAKRLVAKGGFR